MCRGVCMTVMEHAVNLITHNKNCKLIHSCFKCTIGFCVGRMLQCTRAITVVH